MDQDLGLVLLSLSFVGCCAYCLYCWTVIVRNREMGSKWWSVIPFNGETLNVRGRQYLKRFYAGWLLGASIVVAAGLFYRQH